MANKFLFLRTENSPFVGNAADITKNSVLTHSDVDNNFIFLKGEDILTGTTSGNDLVLNKVNADTITIDLSSISGGGGGSGTDSDAIHKNQSAEISIITLKSPIISNDLFLIEDSADGNKKKRTTLNDIKTFVNTGVLDSNAIHDNVSSEISIIPSKTSLVAGDFFLIEDSASGNIKKRTTLDDIKGFVNAGGTDSTAIHDNISGEINAIPAKISLVSNDLLVIEDSAGSTFDKKKITMANIKTFVDAGGGATDNNAIHDNVLGEIAGITLKSPIVSNDLFIIEDSADSNNKKRTTLNDIKTFVNSGGVDSDAIHKTINSEIFGLTEKINLADTDVFVIEDSLSSTFNKKKVTMANLKTFVAAAGGVDTTAIHKAVHSEISVMTPKSPLVGGDFFVIEDSANGNVKRNTTLNDIKTFITNAGISDNNAIHDNISGEIFLIDEKTSLANDDLFVIEDSASSNAKKRIKLSTIKTFVNSGSGGGGGAESISTFPVSCGTSTQNGPGNITDQVNGTLVIPSSDITVSKISFFVFNEGTNIRIRVAVYQKSGGSAILKRAGYSTNGCPNKGINTVNLTSSFTMLEGVEYYLVFSSESNSPNFLAKGQIADGASGSLGFENGCTYPCNNLAASYAMLNPARSFWLRAHS
tara:strand:+ start:1424 stop:3355 length:1932 start_codon:yes stop_codon:yes gene_type:complete